MILCNSHVQRALLVCVRKKGVRKLSLSFRHSFQSVGFLDQLALAVKQAVLGVPLSKLPSMVL